ncbi:hypothetical protein J2T04_003464 [Chryseobacterium lathyri]|uniref:Uncharacterized protein n=1 Tax=Chryseobacterium lathyri TaxID=395933 RepID=A0ABT9SQ39_9FLAO|nr:hypothetical protein [Chryseobacterium lathyri]
MDITKSIRKAVNSNTYWKHDIFQSVVNALSIDYQVDIEIYAEKFATLISEMKIFMLLILIIWEIRKPFPLKIFTFIM